MPNTYGAPEFREGVLLKLRHLLLVGGLLGLVSGCALPQPLAALEVEGQASAWMQLGTAIGSPAQDPAGSRYSVLYSFTGGADGSQPYAGLIADANGNLYGTTAYGGNTNSSCPIGCGVVFKIDPSGKETVLYAFNGGTDGSGPSSGPLIRDTAGNLYGTTLGGGNLGKSCPWGSTGCGVVFEVDPAGNETVLYTFKGGRDGSLPQAGVVRDTAGNLYGTTQVGGGGGSLCPFGSYGCGVVFKVGTLGNETIMWRFSGGVDGSFPFGALTHLGYGTTFEGGNTSGPCSPNGCGVVFRVGQSTEETVYSFKGAPDGSGPGGSPLIGDPAGNLYGTTGGGGNTSSSCPLGSSGCGVVFKLDPSGNETVLYTFKGATDGGFPTSGLLLYKGSLYGTTSSGGTYGGVVFELY